MKAIPPNLQGQPKIRNSREFDATSATALTITPVPGDRCNGGRGPGPDRCMAFQDGRLGITNELSRLARPAVAAIDQRVSSRRPASPSVQSVLALGLRNGLGVRVWVA